MSWASSRRTLILLVVGSVVIVILAAIGFSILYETPSCNDGKQNQDEEGIDCGGSCSLLCTPSVLSPVISFARSIPQENGRVDVIAYVENPNQRAATKDASYEVEVLGENGTPIGSKKGTVSLPPGGNIPVFIPNVLSTSQLVRQVFLTFDTTSFRWYEPEEEPVTLTIRDVRSVGSEEEPRITATLVNPSLKSFRNIPVIVAVFDPSGNVIAASQTIASSIGSRGETNLVFTWNAPFRDSAARIDVRPVQPLP